MLIGICLAPRMHDAPANKPDAPAEILVRPVSHHAVYIYICAPVPAAPELDLLNSGAVRVLSPECRVPVHNT